MDARHFAAGDEPLPEAGPDLDVWIDGRLQEIADLQAQVAETEEVARRRRDQITEWEAQSTAARRRDIDRLTRMLEGVAARYPFAGRSKSRRLPFGIIGRRLRPAAVEVTDDAKAVEFAQLYGLPYKVVVEASDPAHVAAVRAAATESGLPVKASPLKKPITDFLAAAPEVEVVPDEHGLVVHPAADEPFVKLTEESP